MSNGRDEERRGSRLVFSVGGERLRSEVQNC